MFLLLPVFALDGVFDEKTEEAQEIKKDKRYTQYQKIEAESVNPEVKGEFGNNRRRMHYFIRNRDSYNSGYYRYRY